LSTFTAGNFCVNGTLDAKGMTSLGRNWCRWEENITFILKETGSNGVDSGSFLWTCHKPSGFIKAGYFLTTWQITGFANALLNELC